MSGMAGNEAGASGEVLGIEELPWGGNISLVGCLEDTKNRRFDRRRRLLRVLKTSW
jgi:hypothetical protein